MRPVYIWQYPDWPNFRWDKESVITPLAEVRNLQGKIIGMMQVLGFDSQNATSLDMMTQDVVKSCEIEGVLLDSERVRSSVARHLGIPTEGLPEADHYTEGVVQVMIDAVTHRNSPLTAKRLFNWHAALFPTGRSGIFNITVADWRVGDEPMQVVSGAMGHECVHYEAPHSNDVPQMMTQFLKWVENKDETLDSIIKAAIAHLWFVAIHPFDDGNGRITRTITDMLLARSDNMPHRYYSMSATICANRKSYYSALENTTVGDLDVTNWILWFIETLKQALENAIATIERTIRKSQFWQRHRAVAMNERQTRIVNMLWDGFNGKLTTSKWAKITKTSQSSALRDIQALVDCGILEVSDSGGRSTSYTLKMPKTGE